MTLRLRSLRAFVPQKLCPRVEVEPDGKISEHWLNSLRPTCEAYGNVRISWLSVSVGPAGRGLAWRTSFSASIPGRASSAERIGVSGVRLESGRQGS